MSTNEQLVELKCAGCGNKITVDNNSPVNRNFIKDEQLKRFYFEEGEKGVLCGSCHKATTGTQSLKEPTGTYNPANLQSLLH